MKKVVEINKNKEAIIAEYLMGGISYRTLGAKYQVDFRTLHGWVMRYQGRSMKKIKAKKVEARDESSLEELPTDVVMLQKELRKARLENKLLNSIIDIAGEQLKTDIRKKHGTKQ